MTNLKNILLGTALALATAGCGDKEPQKTREQVRDSRESVSVAGKVTRVTKYNSNRDTVYASSGILKVVDSPLTRDLEIQSRGTSYHVTTTGNKWNRIENGDSVYLSGTCKYEGCPVNGGGDVDLVYAKVRLMHNK